MSESKPGAPGTVEHLCSEIDKNFGSIPAAILYQFVQKSEKEYDGVLPLTATDLVSHLVGTGYDDDGEMGKFIIGYFGGSSTTYVPFLEADNTTTTDWLTDSWTTKKNRL